MRSAVILHIDLDAFFASVEQRDRPSLKGKPVIIGADPKEGRGRGVVSTCSYEARRYGVHSAMPISRAYQLCPCGIFLPVDMKKYAAVSQQVFQILEQFASDIEPVSIDEAFVEITSSYHLFGSPESTGRKIKDLIYRQLGLTASIGIAPVKFVAKIASDYCKPDGLLEIKEAEVSDFLRPLPVERLWGVGPKTKSALTARGIKTIGDIGRLPKEALVERFGQHGLHLHLLSNGIDPRGVERLDEVLSVSHEHTFEMDTGRREDIYSVLLNASERLSRRLRKRDLKGKTISVKIRLKGFKTYTRARTIPERTNYIDVIYREARKIFDVFFRPGMKIRLIGVRVSNFEDPYISDGLFSDPSGEKKERLHKVIDRIKDKFGEQAIRRPI